MGERSTGRTGPTCGRFLADSFRGTYDRALHVNGDSISLFDGSWNREHRLSNLSSDHNSAACHSTIVTVQRNSPDFHRFTL